MGGRIAKEVNDCPCGIGGNTTILLACYSSIQVISVWTSVCLFHRYLFFFKRALDEDLLLVIISLSFLSFFLKNFGKD